VSRRASGQEKNITNGNFGKGIVMAGIANEQ
jgi:hypothetical protein